MTDPEHTTRQNQVPRPKVPALKIMSLNTNRLSTVFEYCTDPQGGHTHIAELPFIFSYCDGDTLTHFM
jgi:hypothetical protein